MEEKYYVIKKITKEQNKSNIKKFLKEMAAFSLALIVATILSILAYT